MNDITFSDSFRFVHVRYKNYRHTDCSAGSPYHYLAHMLYGSAKIVSEDGELSISEGDWFYVPLNTVYHSYWTGNAAEGNKIEWYSLGFTYLPLAEAHNYGMQLVQMPEASHAVISELCDAETVSCRSVGRFYELFEDCQASMKRSESSLHSDILDTAAAYMWQHPKCSVPEIAAACHISESTLYSVFRKFAHCTPVELNHRLLAEKAADLLMTTDLPVEEISSQLGFCSTAYFRKILRRIYAKTPRELREQSYF